MKFLVQITLAMLLLAPAKLLACATCYGGNIDSTMAEGMNWGIFTLLIVVATVLGVFLAFLIYVIRKSEALDAVAPKTTPQISKV